jgi:hypothetical protein
MKPTLEAGKGVRMRVALPCSCFVVGLTLGIVCTDFVMGRITEKTVAIDAVDDLRWARLTCGAIEKGDLARIQKIQLDLIDHAFYMLEVRNYATRDWLLSPSNRGYVATLRKWFESEQDTIRTRRHSPSDSTK